jgi:hypothetical protein
MRHGLTVALVGLGFGLLGLARAGESGEPLDDQLGRRIQPIFLLTRVDVQTDLKLLPDQIAGVNQAGEILYRKAQMLRGKSGPAVVEERRKIDEGLTQWLKARLTLNQLERLREIDLQWEGAAAMARPIVAEYLGLTPDQKQKVTQWVTESRQQRERATWTAIDHFRLTAKAVTTLSDKQKELWADLVGRPCQFSSVAPKQTSQDPRSARGPDGRQPVRR